MSTSAMIERWFKKQIFQNPLKISLKNICKWKTRLINFLFKNGTRIFQEFQPLQMDNYYKKYLKRTPSVADFLLHVRVPFSVLF